MRSLLATKLGGRVCDRRRQVAAVDPFRTRSQGAQIFLRDGDADLGRFHVASLSHTPTIVRLAPVGQVHGPGAAAPSSVWRRPRLMRVGSPRRTRWTSRPFAERPLQRVGNILGEVSLVGTSFQGSPWVVALVYQGEERGSLLVGLSETSEFAERFLLSLSGFSTTPLGKDLVLGVTTTKATDGFASLPAGAETRIITAAGVGRGTVEIGAAIAPAIATAERRTAFAYVSLAERPEIHLAMLDENAQRIGDVHTIAATPREKPKLASTDEQAAGARGGDVTSVLRSLLSTERRTH